MQKAPAQTPVPDIQARLGLDPSVQRRQRRGRWLRWSAIVTAFAIVGVAMLRGRGDATPVTYETEKARRDTLTVSVSATGSLESLTKVTVGTEVSGTVDEITVDYNSRVKKGQVLARINTDKMQAQAEQARAALGGGRAKHQQSVATLAEARAQLARLREVRTLSGGKVPSQTELDAQEATAKRAEADEASGAAGETQAQASLAAIEADLRKAVIRSPIDGIVLERSVELGQTVAAQFQTPTLFTLAEDLTKMRLSVDVDEADVGQVREGLRATFTVDAYPNRTFESTVTEVRSTATTTNGVVTYKTMLSVDNTERLLRPGMTATAYIVVTEVRDALLVPNAAFRYVPPVARTRRWSLLPAPPSSSNGLGITPDKGKSRVWVLPAGQATPSAVTVTAGSSDGTWTVLTEGSVAAGVPVVVNAVVAQ